MFKTQPLMPLPTSDGSCPASMVSITATLHAVRQHSYLARPSEELGALFLVIDGWIARYRLLNDGRRQIIALHLPGDLCDIGWMGSASSNEHYIAVVSARTARIPIESVWHALFCSRAAGRLFWEEIRQQNGRQAEWVVNLGRKSAMERIAYLFCELTARIGRVSEDGPSGRHMPLTQMDIADITGLTPVHVNRILQEMRAADLIELRAKRLKIFDFAKLCRLALYRHVPQMPAHACRFRHLVHITPHKNASVGALA